MPAEQSVLFSPRETFRAYDKESCRAERRRAAAGTDRASREHQMAGLRVLKKAPARYMQLHRLILQRETV